MNELRDLDIVDGDLWFAWRGDNQAVQASFKRLPGSW
jgi:hypothetical protein